MIKFSLVLPLTIVLSSLGLHENANAYQDSFRIKSFKKPNLCFDVANNVIANGTPVQVANCKDLGHSAQTWIMGDRMPNLECADGLGNCLYQVQLVANRNFCLDYQYSTQAPADGSKLQLWQCKDRRDGDAAYWGMQLSYGAQAFRMTAGIPGVGVFRFSPSISLDANEGQVIKMRDFTSNDTVNNYYQYWAPENF
jgi:hypothetical protein